MGKPGQVRPKDQRFGEIRMGAKDLGTQVVNGSINKPSVEYVMGRNESHKASFEKPLFSVGNLVPIVLRGLKK